MDKQHWIMQYLLLHLQMKLLTRKTGWFFFLSIFFGNHRNNIMSLFDLCWVYCFWVGQSLKIHWIGEVAVSVKHLCQFILPLTLILLWQRQAVLCVLSFVCTTSVQVGYSEFKEWRVFELRNNFVRGTKLYETFSNISSKIDENKISHRGDTNSLGECR